MARLTSHMAGDFPATDAEGRRQLRQGWVNIALIGGMVTRKARQLLEFGRSSLVRNLRGDHPGYHPRGGSSKLHATAADSRVMSLFQFAKGRTTERHFLAQFADGTIKTASTAPPNVSATTFGSTLFAGASDPRPGCWAVLDDILIFATGADLPQFWAGDEDRLDGFFVFKGSGSGIPAVPDEGMDYTVEVGDGDDGTVAVVDSLGTSASDHCLMFRTALPKLTGVRFEMAKGNGTAATASLYKYNGAWVGAGSITDTTASGSATLAIDGSWTLAAAVTDARAVYQQGVCGFWWRAFFSAQLDSEVEIAEVRYTADPSPMQIVWDSMLQPAVECQLYVAADTVYYRYDYAACDLSGFATADKFYMAFAGSVEAIYIDPGDSPNSGGSAIDKVGRFDGETFNEAAVVSDGTSGFSRPGWVVIGRPTAKDQPRQFQANQWRAFWYYFTFTTAAFSDDVLVSVYGQPFYDVADFGTKCLCCAAWKQRALYVFDRHPQYIYVSALEKPLVLRGDDSNILTPGDGRAHAVRIIVCFHNEILVLQEEHGTIGGCTTLYQGRDDATFGKRILSTHIGGWTAKAAALVEGVYVSTATEERVATMVYWLSWHGLVRCDGRGVMDVVSDAVADRFDPRKPTTCARRGYEDRGGVFYDRSCHVLRVWLVCGATATEPNWFGVYDLVDGSWSEDAQAAHYTAMCEAEAAAGAVAVLQVAGDSDGQVWLLNTGTTDEGWDDDQQAATADDIDCQLDLEFSAGARWLTLQDVRLRLDVSAGATMTLATARDGRTEETVYTRSESLSAKIAGEETVTVTRPVKTAAGHVTLSLRSAALTVHDVAVRATVEEER